MAKPAALLTICAWCPDFDKADPRNAHASHGICPACLEREEKSWSEPLAPAAV